MTKKTDEKFDGPLLLWTRWPAVVEEDKSRSLDWFIRMM